MSACAALGGEDGGADNLPGRGIAGWVEVATPERPFLIGDPESPLLGGPSALWNADGTIELWLHRRNDDGTYDVLHATSDASGTAFGNAALVLTGARDPSVARASDGTLMLAFDTPEGLALARAPGPNFAESPLELLPTTNLPEATAPSLVLDADRVILYAIEDGTLIRTEAGPDLAFGAPTTVLSPGEDCTDTDGTPEPCWDGGALVDAEVRLARTPTGRSVHRVFYAATNSGPTDLGFAASYDGFAFSRYPFNPVLTGAYQDSGPTTLALEDRYVLYWGEARDASVGGVSAAFSTPAAMADRW
jgi:hypothetical protein